MQLKIGDYVKIDHNIGYGHYAGDIGIVKDIRGSEILVYVEGRVSISAKAPNVSYHIDNLKEYDFKARIKQAIKENSWKKSLNK